MTATRSEEPFRHRHPAAMRLGAVLAAATLIAALAFGGGIASGASVKTVKVTSDDLGTFYLPNGGGYVPGTDMFSEVNFLQIRRGDSIRWRSYGYDGSPGDSGTGHNVRLTEAPKSVKGKALKKMKKQFEVPAGEYAISSTIDFKRKFTVPGSYIFVCSEHTPGMRMGVKVRK